MVLNLLVEGVVDEVVGAKLIQLSGHKQGNVYGRRGCDYIRQRCEAFRRAKFPCLALVDFMDAGEQCPGDVPRKWLSGRSNDFLLRVVVREIESWLLADREGIADFLRVPKKKIPSNPENLLDPKQALVNLARSSRLRDRREAIVPLEGFASTEGPLYASEISQYVNESWSIQRAIAVSPSLDRCWKRLNELDKET